jgi:hypothetical protein
LNSYGGLEKGRLFSGTDRVAHQDISLLGAGVLGDSLGALGHGVLGQLTGQQEPHSSLDFPGGDGGPLVVVGQAGGLSSNPLENVIDKRVHDAHGLGGDASVRVHLLENLIDVDGIGLLPPLLALLLITLGDSFLGLARLLGGLSGGLGRHVAAVVDSERLTASGKNGANIYSQQRTPAPFLSSRHKLCCRYLLSPPPPPHTHPPPVAKMAPICIQRILRPLSTFPPEPLLSAPTPPPPLSHT